jgi:aryl-alcohol dehydrogenase-like predicted oxidoreductase
MVKKLDIGVFAGQKTAAERRVGHQSDVEFFHHRQDLRFNIPVPYSPLGRGFLTGKYLNNSDFAADDFRKNNDRFQQASLDLSSFFTIGRISASISRVHKEYSVCNTATG